jgi:hypothetical protein
MILYITIVMAVGWAVVTPLGYGIINCDPQQGIIEFPPASTKAVRLEVDSSGTLFNYFVYYTNLQCTGYPDHDVTFSPQCATLHRGGERAHLDSTRLHPDELR